MNVVKNKQGRLITFFICLIVSLMFSPAVVHAQQIIINELYNSSTTDEWLELLVVQDSLDIRGWDIRDFSSGGAAQSPLTFTNSSLWNNLRKGTIIVVGTASTTFTEDSDPSDYLLKIKSNNAIYFTATGTFSLAGSSDAVQIRDATDTHVFGVSWGTNNASSLPSPKVHFSGASTSNTSTVFNEDTLPELTSTSNWTQNTTSSQGVGNSVNNSAWIAALKAHPEGPGQALVLPSLVKGNVLDTVAVRVTTSSLTISSVDVLVPSLWSWSHTAPSVAVTGGGSPTVAVSGDTIQLTGATVTPTDSITIQILGITPPDSTDNFTFNVLTGPAPDSLLPISVQPKTLVYGSPRPISEVKTNDVNGVPLLFGKYVTVRGIVTVANEFHGPGYIQDNTGGIGFFDSTISLSTNIGDEILVTGTMSPFSGLCELGSPILHQIISTGNSVTPQIVTALQIKNDGAGGVENFEGMLVRVNAAAVRDTFNSTIPSWAVSGSGTNYRLVDGSGFVDIRVDNNVNFANTPAPQGTFDVIGVIGQFKAASPFIGGYQFMPRSSADILSVGPIFSTLPVESNITATSFRISWTTVNNGTSRLRYGTTKSYELGVIEPDNLLRKNHAIDLTGLLAATIYHVQAFSVSGTDTSAAGDLIVSTASPAGTTGQMNVYFNKTVDNSVAIGENALGNQSLVSRLTTRLNNAQRSIDLALYSLSGSNEGDVIAAALVAAKNRGVTVRVICENDNKTSNAFTTIQSNGIPLITDTYDGGGGGGLMHNKFSVIDYPGGAPESVWVWGGSWNPTISGTNSDRQNSIEIQDVALAGAYHTEFNEMWGSTTSTPNAGLSHFGSRKTDNTPHHFVINGIAVESYFSPSDHTTSHLVSTIHKAQHSVSASILTFTRKDIADTVIARKNAGDKTRLVIDNNTDTGNQFAYLQSNGIDVHLKGGSGLLHHKYVSIDGDQVGGNQYTVTGSHNWSNSAENSNDENTLIIQNPRIANLYLQEFAARYYEAGGTDSIHVTSSPLFSVTPSSINYDTVLISSSRLDSVVVSNSGNALLTVTAISSTNAAFTVSPASVSVAPASSQKIYITFSPLAVGVQTGSIIFTHNAPGNPDTVLVQGAGKSGGDGSITTALDMSSGWNMISLPLTVTDSRTTTLFPAAVSRAFAYQGTYVARDSFNAGAGYWLKFPSAQSDSITGKAITNDTIDVGVAWNMIGAITNPVPVSSIIQNPPGIVTTTYSGYNGAYFTADTLKPGKAYWVKTNQAGKLMVSSSSIIPKAAAQNELKGFNTLTVSAGGNSRTVYFGKNIPESFSTDKYEAPPLPPEGGFDVRFASGKTVEICSKALKSEMEIPLRITTSISPIKVGWAIDSKEGNSYTLKATSPQGMLSQHLKDRGEISLQGTIESVVLAVAPENVLPSAFALGQNYPNPFNPTTTIPFSLPRAATVTLKVYDLLGRSVVTLLDHEEREAGYFTMTVDASHLPSGVYIYRLRAASTEGVPAVYQEQKKFLLIK